MKPYFSVFYIFTSSKAISFMSELYPIKFAPIFKQKVWGGDRLKNVLNKKNATDHTGESWEISPLSGSESVVENGFLAENTLSEIIEVYMGDLVGESVFDRFGTGFPLLLKFIDAQDLLSVQVHPDDVLAQEKYGMNGKTEAWYVVEATNDAYLYSGFNQKLTKQNFKKNIELKTVKDTLNKEYVGKGDVFFIPAGRIHATGPGVLFAEIQQASDITYRVYDWDRKDRDGNLRELHVDEALEAMDFEVADNYKTEYSTKENRPAPVVKSPYFVVNKLQLTEKYDAEYNLIDSFVAYMCVEGRVSIEYKHGKTETLEKGETVLIPAVFESVKLIPDESVELLEVYIPDASTTSE